MRIPTEKTAGARGLADIRLIALDLDGTLLNEKKELSPRSRAALEAAAGAGIEIIPSTGRFYRGIPEVIRSLPFVRGAITVNGAHVIDLRSGETVYSAEIPRDDAVAFFEYLDTLPVIYDCYVDGWGYITADMQERAPDYIDYAPSLHMVRTLRSPVPELKAFLCGQEKGVQKMQLFTRDVPLRDRLIPLLTGKYPSFVITSSLPNNIEINGTGADKGRALLALAEHLGIAREQTMAFGDGTNDMSMILAAGFGVAMGNAHPAVKAAADFVTADNNSDGVAVVIEKLLRGEFC